jgi:heterodisulfide reductase subunit B
MKVKECSKCGKHREATRHHIAPISFYGDGQTVCLCHECHIAIEKLYLRVERAFGNCRGRYKLPALTYYQIFVNFLTGVSDDCYTGESRNNTSTRKKSNAVEA